MQKGDQVLCYKSSPKCTITALLEVESKTADEVSLKFVKSLDISLKAIKEKYADIYKRNAQVHSPFTESQKNIFNGTYFNITKEQFDILIDLDSKSFQTHEDKIQQDKEIQAHKTGAKAESIFKENYQKIPLFKNKKIEDKTLDGVGYDFELTENNETIFCEIKGCKSGANTIFFTDKELKTAEKEGDSYFLVYVDIDDKTLSYIQNPYKILKNAKPLEYIAISYTINSDAINFDYKIKFESNT